MTDKTLRPGSLFATPQSLARFLAGDNPERPALRPFLAARHVAREYLLTRGVAWSRVDLLECSHLRYCQAIVRVTLLANQCVWIEVAMARVVLGCHPSNHPGHRTRPTRQR